MISAKQKTSALTAMLFAGLALTFVPTTAWAKAKGPKATFVKGTVEMGKKTDGPFKRLKRNKRVKAGSFVRTGENSRAELTFTDGSVLRLGPSSLLHVKEAGFDTKAKKVEVSAQLVGGKAWAKVSKLVGSDAKFEVKSQNAVAGVRGTVFRVNVDSDNATVVKVYDGAVAVSNAPHFAENPDKGKPVGPINPNRKEIARPFAEISKKQWEQTVKNLMQVRVGADGKMDAAAAFTAESDKLEDPEWVNWNLACDSGNCDAY